jgi:hypothetical protein
VVLLLYAIITSFKKVLAFYTEGRCVLGLREALMSGMLAMKLMAASNDIIYILRVVKIDQLVNRHGGGGVRGGG